MTREFDPPPAPQQAVALLARVLPLRAPVATCTLEHAISLLEQEPAAMEDAGDDTWQITVPAERLAPGVHLSPLLRLCKRPRVVNNNQFAAADQPRALRGGRGVS